MKKEYLASRTLLTPRSQKKALRAAERAKELAARTDENGIVRMSDPTAEFIDAFMRRNIQEKRAS